MTGPAGEFRRFHRRVLRHTLLAGACGGALLHPLLGAAQALGFWLGAGISALALRLHALDLERQAGREPADAARRARVASLARSGLRAATLAVAFVRPEFSFAWAAAGLFAGHLVLVAHRVGEAARAG